MEYWYPPSSSLIDNGYEKVSVDLLKKYLGEMTESNISELILGIMKQMKKEKQNYLDL